MKYLKFILLFYSLFLPLLVQAQEINVKDSTSLGTGQNDNSMYPSYSRENHQSQLLTLMLERYFEDKMGRNNLDLHLSLDPWEMSAIGADIDPMIRSRVLFPVFEEGDLKGSFSMFADKNYVNLNIRAIRYVAGFRMTYQDRWFLHNEIGYNHDFTEYGSLSSTLGYIWNPFTFYVRPSFYFGGYQLSNPILDPEEKMNFNVNFGIEMKVNDNVKVGIDQSTRTGGAIGIKIKQ